ncbi:uncharacterized protein SCHCODRAFT_02645677 [Schizophyllum commune H4-8]|uniref:uncharacterized protein n=1 Tax=Schizophyllum commune (strain H4-8 / FGSC 9210) TaxID=578458 RepID=UPI002160225E|nr:uncharacterized protein SCHCODRAFT_02645677 [Schizophyllum commune H4-8]KAI5884881.1 hypothetical protein SCHCODRAFT_02645677 [Schizophyllum commune H4-8]
MMGRRLGPALNTVWGKLAKVLRPRKVRSVSISATVDPKPGCSHPTFHPIKAVKMTNKPSEVKEF